MYLKKEINMVIRKDIFSKKLGLLKSVPVISNNQPSPEKLNSFPKLQ